MDPQLRQIHLKTLRYKTEIFKLVTKHKSMADKKKQNKTALEGFFIDAKLRLLILN